MDGSVVDGLRCVRCGEIGPLRHDTWGCAACRELGVPSALLANHDLGGVDGPQLWQRWAQRRPSVWSHAELLPVAAGDAVSLAEGGTPLLELPEAVGGPGALVKDERRNPTGSFKDRFFSVATSWARSAGWGTIAVASSGNAGVSAAAYAAAAGLGCVMIATAGVGRTWLGTAELHGAEIVWAADADERWEVLREHADEWAVLSNASPVPVSSLWVGIEGYKTLAYELVRDLGRAPAAVLVPISRGDAFAGMWAGFQELAQLGVIAELPRMVAAERHPSLSRALAEDLELPPQVPDEDSPASSIRSPRATVMALRAIRESGGTAVACTDEQLTAARQRLGRAGIGAEVSSAAGLVALDELRRRGEVAAGEPVVQLLTAHAANQPETLPGS